MNPNTCSCRQRDQPPGNPPDDLAALQAVIDRLAAQDRDHLPDAALADQILALRRLVDRLEGQWLGDLAALDARGAAGADQGIQGASTASWLRNRLRLGATAASSCRSPRTWAARAVSGCRSRSWAARSSTTAASARSPSGRSFERQFESMGATYQAPARRQAPTRICG